MIKIILLRNKFKIRKVEKLHVGSITACPPTDLWTIGESLAFVFLF